MSRLNLRHVVISLGLGMGAYKLVEAHPEWLLDAQGKPMHEQLTPQNVGIGVGALAMYSLYSGRAEGYGFGELKQDAMSVVTWPYRKAKALISGGQHMDGGIQHFYGAPETFPGHFEAMLAP